MKYFLIFLISIACILCGKTTVPPMSQQGNHIKTNATVWELFKSIRHRYKLNVATIIITATAHWIFTVHEYNYFQELSQLSAIVTHQEYPLLNWPSREMVRQQNSLWRSHLIIVINTSDTRWKLPWLQRRALRSQQMLGYYLQWNTIPISMKKCIFNWKLKQYEAQ